MCECLSGNHLIFHVCPLFDATTICEEDCRITMLKDGIEKEVSAKLGHPVTREYIDDMCRNCGLNSACRNSKLAEEIERGKPGEPNGPQTPIKTR